MSNQIFPVTGLTCGHCVGAITTEVGAADNALTDAEVTAALEEAGDGDYVLVAI